MKTLILYTSKYGTTKKCSELIKAGLTDSKLYDLTESNDISLKPYDKIIIGTSIYFGKINKTLSNFIDENLPLLLTKEIGLFMCSKETTLEQSINKELFEHAQYKSHFGFELNISNMKFMDKIITKKIAQVSNDESHLKLEQINDFIKSLNLS